MSARRTPWLLVVALGTPAVAALPAPASADDRAANEAAAGERAANEAAAGERATDQAAAGERATDQAAASERATDQAAAGEPMPTWFVAGRLGPSVIERKGSYEYASRRDIYGLERNARWEIVLGRYLSRHVALAGAIGSGPYPKYDAADPLYGETTRFEVLPWHATLDLEIHAARLVLAVRAGGIYEHTKGFFVTQAPGSFGYAFHTVAFRRFGVLGAVHTGAELHWGHWGVEVLAEAAAMKLARGTYEHGMTSPGLSDDETGYVGSLFLGLRWH